MQTLAAKKKEYFDGFPGKLANLRKQLEASPGKFFGGVKPMYADFLIYHHLECSLRAEGKCLDGGENKPVRQFLADVGALKGVAAYLASRPASGAGFAAGGVGFPGSIMATVVEHDG